MHIFRETSARIHHGVLMTDRRSQTSMRMVLLSLRHSAPLRPTAVWCRYDTPLTPPLSLGARCALRERTGLTHAAPPALDSGGGWCFVAPGCIFERDTEARRNPKSLKRRGTEEVNRRHRASSQRDRRDRKSPIVTAEARRCGEYQGREGCQVLYSKGDFGKHRQECLVPHD